MAGDEKTGALDHAHRTAFTMPVYALSTSILASLKPIDDINWRIYNASTPERGGQIMGSERWVETVAVIKDILFQG